MALFRRKNNQVSSDPYYSNQQSNKPMAWLLAVVTFVVTLLIIMALFFAGRWVWRHTLGDNSSGTESTTPQTGEGTENSPTVDGNVPDNSGASATQEGQTGAKNQTQQDGSAQGGETQGSSAQGSNSPQTSSTSTAVPSANSQPNTGPTENMLAVFVVTSVLGFIVHKKWLAK